MNLWIKFEYKRKGSRNSMNLFGSGCSEFLQIYILLICREKSLIWSLCHSLGISLKQ